MTEESFLKVSEAARVLKVSTQTMRAWITTGKLKAIKLPNTQWRVSAEEIRKVLETESVRD